MLPYWFTAVVYWMLLPSARRFVDRRYSITKVNVYNIPAEGPVILAANHLRRIDSVMMAAVANYQPRRVTYMVHSRHFKARSLKGLIITTGLTLLGQIPLEGAGSNASMKGINRAEKLLGRGRVLGIHVEGTRSPDGRLYDARLGFAYLALRTQATIVPVAFSYKEASAGSSESRARIHYGKPIMPSEYSGLRARELARLVTERIHLISGQERAMRYAHVEHGASEKAHF